MKRNTSRWPSVNVSVLGAVIIAIVASASGCAYFNLFYNTRKAYRAAEQSPRLPDGSVNRQNVKQYEDVIQKCQTLITTYPKSGWVDDAILLMGKCFYRIEDYDEAITKFNELQASFPKSDLNVEGQLYLAKCHLAKDDPATAVIVLDKLFQDQPKSDFGDEILSLLSTSSVKAGQEEEALHYHELLAKRYPKSDYRLTADLEIADIYIERGEFEKAMAIFERVRKMRLNEEKTIIYLSRLVEVFVGLERYDDAINAYNRLKKLPVDTQGQARLKLLFGQALDGKGQLKEAMETYRDVKNVYPKSMFAAEASFRLGVICQERLDSLEVAKKHFENVPRQYANSPFSDEAIERSVNIGKLQKLHRSLESGAEEGKATAQFDLAEVQLFQIKDHKKALATYQKFLQDYPDNELAPRAAWAIAYIYDQIIGDKAAARNAYTFIVDRYPDSQQAEYARQQLVDDRASGS